MDGGLESTASSVKGVRVRVRQLRSKVSFTGRFDQTLCSSLEFLHQPAPSLALCKGPLDDNVIADPSIGTLLVRLGIKRFHFVPF